MILSDASSAVTSSEFGRTATPWIDSSSDISTKSCRLMKPRTGGGAVTTMMVSPASGSTSRCSRPGLAIGTVTLASAGSVMLRIATSGCVGVCIVSAKVSVQLAPPAWSSPVSEGICGRLRRMRIACPLSSGNRLTSAMIEPALAADRLDIDRLCGIEHQPHRIGAAKQCRGRGGGKGKRQAQAVAASRGVNRGAGRRAAVAGGGLVSAGGSDAARVIFCGGRRGAAARPGAGVSFGGARARRFRRGRYFRRRLGLDLDIGLLGDRLRRRRRDLAGLPRCRRFIGGLRGRGRRGCAAGCRRAAAGG